jgi:flagellar motor protein MotB
MSEHDAHGGGGGDAHGGGGGDAHGGGHKKHKKHHPHMPHEHEHEEGWIVSFADNVLLQMGFFVILLAMNIGPKANEQQGAGSEGQTPNNSMLDFAIAMRAEFNNPVRLDSSAPEDAPLIRRMKERQAVGETHTPGPEGDKHNVQSIRPDDWVNKGGYVEFDDRSSELSDQAKETLEAVANGIVGQQWIIEVRGHASRLEAGRDHKAGMDLSFERASVVAAELMKHGVSADVLRVVACGVYDGVKARPSSESDYAANQRVEVVHTLKTRPADPYSAGASAREKD